MQQHALWQRVGGAVDIRLGYRRVPDQHLGTKGLLAAYLTGFVFEVLYVYTVSSAALIAAHRIIYSDVAITPLHVHLVPIWINTAEPRFSSEPDKAAFKYSIMK